MTETPAPDAAVQIAVSALRNPRSLAIDDAADVCDVLHRAGWLHDPAEVERLREGGCPARVVAGGSRCVELDAARARVAELAEAIGELFILDVGRSTQGRAWVKVDQEGFDRLRAALDAVPAADTTSGGENR